MRRSTNIKLVSVTGPATKGFEKVSWNSHNCRGYGGTNTEAVTGVIETVTEVTEPRVDQEWEERTAVRRHEQRPRDIATKRKVVTEGRHRTEGIARRTNKENDASAKRVDDLMRRRMLPEGANHTSDRERWIRGSKGLEQVNSLTRRNPKKAREQAAQN